MGFYSSGWPVFLYEYKSFTLEVLNPAGYHSPVRCLKNIMLTICLVYQVKCRTYVIASTTLMCVTP